MLAALRRRTDRVYYGWLIVAGSIAMGAVSGAFYMQAFGAYIVQLQQEFGWSKTVLVGVYSMNRLESGFIGPLEGWLIDKVGPRAVMRVGVVLSAVGLMLLSHVNSVFAYYAVFFMIALGSSLTTVLTITITVSRWFIKRRTLALALATMGGSIGGLMVPLVAWSLVTYGWRPTAFVSGLIILAVGLPIAQMFRRAPEDYGLLPDGDPVPASDVTPGAPPEQGSGQARRGSRPRVELEGFTLKQALRTRTFWIISAGHGLAVLSISVVAAHFILYLVQDKGLDLRVAVLFQTVILATQVIMRPIGGFFADLFTKRFVLSLNMLMTAAGLLILAVSPAIWPIFIFAIFQGAAAAVRAPLLTSIRAEYFGRKSIGTILGFGTMLAMIASTTGPILVAVLEARFDYQTSFLIISGLVALGAVLFAFATKPPLPQEEPSVESAAQPSAQPSKE